MEDVLSPKDAQRVQRSIDNIMRKIDISMKLQSGKYHASWLRTEKDLEDYCLKHGLIYSPTYKKSLL